MVHIHNGMLLSFKKECILMRWMNLGPIILSKSERERQILYIKACYGMKDSTDEPTSRVAVEMPT